MKATMVPQDSQEGEIGTLRFQASNGQNRKLDSSGWQIDSTVEDGTLKANPTRESALLYGLPIKATRETQYRLANKKPAVSTILKARLLTPVNTESTKSANIAVGNETFGRENPVMKLNGKVKTLSDDHAR